MRTDTKALQKRLRDGISAVNQGRRADGRDLLRQVVEADHDLELGWWWLSQASDDPRERWRALENVLRLNPQHSEARQQLAEMMPTRAAEAQWGDVLPGVPLEANDGVDDPYQCPYCGLPTREEDRRCPNCGGGLYTRVAKSRSSQSLRTLFLLLGIALALSLLEMAGPLFALAVRQGAADQTNFELLLSFFGVQPFLGNFLALTALVAQWLIRFYVVRAGVLLALMLALRERLSLAYYGTLLVVLVDLIASVYLLVAGYLGVVAVVLNLGLDVAAGVILFGANYEFAINHERLLVKPDSKSRGPVDFYKRGHDYRRMGMWALAVAQWRKAVGLAPNVTQYYKDLGIGYAQIQRYDRSLRALSEAQRQMPDDAELKEIVALVRAKAGAQRSRQ